MYDSFNIHGFFLTTGKGVIFLALNIETNGVVNTCKTLVRCKEFSDNMAGLHQGRWQSFYPDQGEGWVVRFLKIYLFISPFGTFELFFAQIKLSDFAKQKASSILFKRAISMAFIYMSLSHAKILIQLI